MKKILVTAMCAAAFGLAAWAEGTDVLMWYLNLGESEHEGTASSTTFDSINFYMVDSSDKSRTPVVSLNERTYENVGDLQKRQNAGISAGDGVYIGNYYTDLSGINNLANYEFMMTLYNHGDLVAWTKWLYNDHLDASEHLTLQNLQKMQAASGLYSIASLSDLAGGGSSLTPYGFGKDVVPEPTGGLLMLVGASLLALRRRRRA
jgi:opacity protein-like surface antigen